MSEETSSETGRYRRRHRDRQADQETSEEMDEAAKRREQRRREREARRAERDAEDAADEEKRKKEREERRRRRDNTDAPAEESTSARRRREREEEEKRKAEEEAKQREEEKQLEEERRKEEQRRKEEERRKAEERRRREEEEEEERRRMEEEKNRVNQDHLDAAEEDEEEEEEEEEEETIIDRLNPQKKQAILEGLANELRRIVEEREAKNVPATQQELDELDLRLRSLRTQLRKAEELSTQLGKQKREIDEKIEKNKRDVARLKNEVKKTEDENNLLIKEGKKVAPQKTVKKTLPPKKGNFVNVVRKAQAAAWEEKFMAMKAKQKESNKMSEELMSKMNRVKRTDSPLLTGLKKDKKGKKKEEKEEAPAWAKSQLKKGSTKPWGDEKKKEADKKPDWSGRVALKKTEKKEMGDLGESKRQDWREGLKKAPKSPGIESEGGEPEWKAVSLNKVPRNEDDD